MARNFTGTDGGTPSSNQVLMGAASSSVSFWFRQTAAAPSNAARIYDDSRQNTLWRSGATPNIEFTRDYTVGQGIWICSYTDQGSPVLSQWNHFCWTHTDGSTPKCYVNGIARNVTVGTAPTGTIVTGNLFPLFIGNRADGTRPAEGDIAHLGIYDRELTAVEVDTAMRLGYAATPRFYWQLNTGSSPETDQGPNAANLTMTGSAVRTGPLLPGGEQFPAADSLGRAVGRSILPMLRGPGRDRIMGMQRRDEGARRMVSMASGTQTRLNQQPVTGQTFLQTLAATAASAASFVLQSRIIRSVTSTATPTLVKQAQIVRSVTSTGAATVVKQVNKILSATSTGSAVLVATKLVFKTISATATGTATLIKQANKNLSTSSTGTATLIKQVNKALSVTGTGTATLVKQVNKVLSATATGTATLVKRPGKVLSATSTGAATMVRQANKALSVTSTGAASLVKQVNKILSVTSTGTASMAQIKVVLKTIAATATGTATMALRVSKTLTATASSVASPFVLLVSKRLSTTSTGTAVLSTARTVVKTITATATGVASLLTAFRQFVLPRNVTTAGSAGTGPRRKNVASPASGDGRETPTNAGSVS